MPKYPNFLLEIEWVLDSCEGEELAKRKVEYMHMFTMQLNLVRTFELFY